MPLYSILYLEVANKAKEEGCAVKSEVKEQVCVKLHRKLKKKSCF